MKVYVVEKDVYESRRVYGVFATLELAQAAGQPDSVWTAHGEDTWWDQYDWHMATTITEFELVDKA